MAAPVSDKKQSETASQKANASLGQHVLRQLGQPSNLHQVQVRALWDEHYRVNILVGAEITSVRIAHSFFLVTDREGKVLASTPEIVKRY